MKTKVMLLFLIPSLLSGQAKISRTGMTPNEVVNLIKKNVTCPWDEKTVDTFKAGNPDSKVTGIAVCMFADMNVLKAAVANNCQFIITHEPVFYNHTDETGFLKEDQVFLEKMKYIKDNGLIIWRFHDHWHKTIPDGINYGMVRKLGWEKYAADKTMNKFKIPETTLPKLMDQVAGKLGIKSLRYTGDPGMKFTKAAFSAGASGSRAHLKLLEDEEVEVLLLGEVPEWETYMYANDAVAQGRKKAIIFLGHIKSEEEGMAYCAEWMRTFIRNIPVVFISDEPNFRTVTY